MASPGTRLKLRSKISAQHSCSGTTAYVTFTERHSTLTLTLQTLLVTARSQCTHSERAVSSRVACAQTKRSTRNSPGPTRPCCSTHAQEPQNAWMRLTSLPPQIALVGKVTASCSADACAEPEDPQDGYMSSSPLRPAPPERAAPSRRHLHCAARARARVGLQGDRPTDPRPQGFESNCTTRVDGMQHTSRPSSLSQHDLTLRMPCPKLWLR